MGEHRFGGCEGAAEQDIRCSADPCHELVEGENILRTTGHKQIPFANFYREIPKDSRSSSHFLSSSSSSDPYSVGATMRRRREERGRGVVPP